MGEKVGWPVTLREEQTHGLKIFGNRVQWRIFGSRREQVAGDWRRLRNEEQHKLCASRDVIRVIKSRRMR
jgi:hypothetical protein